MYIAAVISAVAGDTHRMNRFFVHITAECVMGVRNRPNKGPRLAVVS